MVNLIAAFVHWNMCGWRSVPNQRSRQDGDQANRPATQKKRPGDGPKRLLQTKNLWLLDLGSNQGLTD